MTVTYQSRSQPCSPCSGLCAGAQPWPPRARSASTACLSGLTASPFARAIPSAQNAFPNFLCPVNCFPFLTTWFKCRLHREASWSQPRTDALVGHPTALSSSPSECLSMLYVDACHYFIHVFLASYRASSMGTGTLPISIHLPNIHAARHTARHIIGTKLEHVE